MHSVLLYYKIIRIQHPERVATLHKEVCRALQLKGRILIGKDGVNGTVSGSSASIQLYKEYCNTTRVFKDIDFKESTAEQGPFPRLSVKARNEIITTDDRETFMLEKRGQHISRDEFHDWLTRQEDMVLLDMRNDYEWEIGRFKNAVRPPMKYFRELKDNMSYYDEFKGKKIVMFCTGGIRCEPASAQFIAHGFDPENLYQLEGGIVKYAEKYGDDGFYEGKCFVFDDRMAVEVGKQCGVVGTCTLCGATDDTYRNCANKYCNKLFLACDPCAHTFLNTCSEACKTVIEDPEAMRPAPANHVMTHRNK